MANIQIAMVVARMWMGQMAMVARQAPLTSLNYKLIFMSFCFMRNCVKHTFLKFKEVSFSSCMISNQLKHVPRNSGEIPDLIMEVGLAILSTVFLEHSPKDLIRDRGFRSRCQ
jgi:hypothetical protein